MSDNRRRVTAVAGFIIICCASVSAAMGQQAPVRGTQVPRIIKYDGDMAYLLAHLTKTYGATIGLEVDPLQPRTQVGFFLRDATLQDALNAIVQSAPKYYWRESGGFFEVLPVKGSSPLLDTAIGSFQVSDVDPAEAINQLMNLPGVQASMSALNLTRGDLGTTSIEKNAGKVSMSLSNGTMRQALHQIAKENDLPFWIFRRDSKGRISISNSPR